jgi:hypothetical protein
MTRVVKRWVLATVLCMPGALSFAAEQQQAIAPELWDRPRSARAVLDQPTIREAIRQHIAQPGSRIIIHHGYGQNPLLQAEELRAWLMTLAVDAARISLLNDVKPGDALKIEVLQ